MISADDPVLSVILVALCCQPYLNGSKMVMWLASSRVWVQGHKYEILEPGYGKWVGMTAMGGAA